SSATHTTARNSATYLRNSGPLICRQPLFSATVDMTLCILSLDGASVFWRRSIIGPPRLRASSPRRRARRPFSPPPWGRGQGWGSQLSRARSPPARLRYLRARRYSKSAGPDNRALAALAFDRSPPRSVARAARRPPQPPV